MFAKTTNSKQRNLRSYGETLLTALPYFLGLDTLHVIACAPILLPPVPPPPPRSPSRLARSASCLQDRSVPEKSEQDDNPLVNIAPSAAARTPAQDVAPPADKPNPAAEGSPTIMATAATTVVITRVGGRRALFFLGVATILPLPVLCCRLALLAPSPLTVSTSPTQGRVEVGVLVAAANSAGAAAAQQEQCSPH